MEPPHAHLPVPTLPGCLPSLCLPNLGYDGGDCCECTCERPETTIIDAYYSESYAFCGDGFACIDPSAPCVNDDDITTGIVDACDTVQMGDAYCDEQNVRVCFAVRREAGLFLLVVILCAGGDLRGSPRPA